MVERVRNRLPVATSRKQTGLSVGWPSAFMRGDCQRSALPRLVAGVCLVDDVDLAAAADHLAVRVALLCEFDGRNDFHKRKQSRERTPLLSTQFFPGSSGSSASRRHWSPSSQRRLLQSASCIGLSKRSAGGLATIQVPLSSSFSSWPADQPE